MPTQTERAIEFRALHQVGDPLILYNIWDAGSAKTVADSGAKALATGSAPVAMAFGYADGENIPLDLALENIKRIIAATDLPVSMDLEGGYGAEPSVVAETITRAVKTGIIGLNFEDQIIGTSELHPLALHCERIEAARRAADSAQSGVFINARTDIFLKAKPDTHDEAMLEKAVTRAKAFEQAGADGFFAPGLANPDLIAKLCEACPLPVNIIALPHVPEKQALIDLGVARISHGPVPYKKMSTWLGEQATAAFG